MTGAGPVRVALVGYGLAGERFHAPFLAVVDGIELAAVVTSDPDRRARARAAHPRAEVVADADALWEAVPRLGVELVVVAAPNRVHVPLARAALAAGCAVVVDKPLAPSVEEARRLLDEAARSGLPLAVFHNRRWDGDFLTVRRLGEEGRLGEVWRLESRFERWRPGLNPDAWRERPEPAEAGGVLFDLGSHLIDQALVLCGPAVSVWAEAVRRRPGAQVDDDTFVAVEHRSGARSHLWASSTAARPGPRFRVQGTAAGYVVWGMDPQEEALRRGERPGGPGWGRVPASRWGTLGVGEDCVAVPTEAGDYGAFYAAMVAALRHGAPVPVPATDAVRTLEVIEAARRSADRGTAVVVA